MLESTRTVDTIVLDKTGTVTTGHMTLTDLHTASGVDRTEALRLVGGLEAASEHPIARAIAGAAQDELGQLPNVTGFINREGLGAEGTVDGHHVVVGRPSLLAEGGLAAPPELDAARQAAESHGRTAIVAGWDGAARAVFVIADSPKPSSAGAITRLR